MEGKGWIFGRFLIYVMLSAATCLSGCTTREEVTFSTARVTVGFDCGVMTTRALDPDESRISDISLMVFDGSGNAEECIWLADGSTSAELSLIKGRRYSIRACANFGYQVYADHIDELEEVSIHLAYPDEYREGIPMTGQTDGIIATEGKTINIELQRLMSKISLYVDRSGLADDVKMDVTSVKIGNCPRSAKAFTESKVEISDQCFPLGFYRSYEEVRPLNIKSADGISGGISLYMLENMQGDIALPVTSDSDKVFDEDDPRRDICSYIEISLDYMSDSLYSIDKGLIYRFYLGESRDNLDVERNCHYRITVRPENDGLSDDGWRVDKSSLVDAGPVSFTAYPASYIRGDIGDQVHIWCEFSPSQAPFDVGEEYMKDDKAEGIYDYRIDDDGHGAVLTLTGPGRGLIYMEAGDPINDAALFVIEVNLPENSTDNQPYGTQHISEDPPACPQTQDYRHHLRPQVPGLSPNLPL